MVKENDAVICKSEQVVQLQLIKVHFLFSFQPFNTFLLILHAAATQSIDGHGSLRVILVSEYFRHLDEVGTTGVRIIEAQLYSVKAILVILSIIIIIHIIIIYTYMHINHALR